MTRVTTCDLGGWDIGQLLFARQQVFPTPWSERRGGSLRLIGQHTANLEVNGSHGEFSAACSRLGHGMTVTVMRANLLQDCSVSATGRGLLVFNFVSTGRSNVTGSSGLSASDGTCLVRMHPEGEPIGSLLSSKQIYAGVRIAISPDRLLEAFDLPGTRDWLVDRVGGCLLFKLDRATLRAVAEILELAIEQVGALLRLEGLALQLLATAVDRLYRSDESSLHRTAYEMPGASLPLREVRHVHSARQMLLVQYKAPPRVDELARLVGTNPGKLSRSFRVAFGESISGFCLRLRMEKARVLILDEGIRSSEAGYAVGYSHHSTFTAAFSRYFGSSPSAVARNTPRETTMGRAD